MINIAVTLHLAAGKETYLKACAALYNSIRLHTEEKLHLFLIHDETLNDHQKSTLSGFIQQHHHQISFIDVSPYPEIVRTSLQYGLPPYSPAVIWRIYLPELLPVDKVLLLDADLIVLFDLAKIWNSCPEPYMLSASIRRKPWDAFYHQVINTPPERYFRIGFCLLNLKNIKTQPLFPEKRVTFLEQVLPRVKHINYLPEQSLYNYFFSSQCKPMAISLIREPHPGASQAIVQERLQRLRKEERIVLDLKGWHDHSPFAAFYRSHLLMTPWGDELYGTPANTA